MSVSLLIGDTPNYATVWVGDLAIHFSYRTPIGYTINGETVVRKNDWGPTTGKHLNRLDNGDKASRVEGDVFESKLAEIVSRFVSA